MSKFNVTDHRSAVTVGRGPLATQSATPDGVTHEGGAGYSRTVETELFLHATTTFVGEDSFYAKEDAGADRLRVLVAQLAVTEDGWEWLRGFLPWLRGDGNVRTAGVLLSLEAVRARLARGLHGNGNRQLVSAVLQRADEPGEALAYWLARYGRKVPMPVKRGIADAASRLYTERNYLRYDSGARGVRFSDVLELTHPRGSRTSRVEGQRSWQDDLFRWSITARHDREGAVPPSSVLAVEARWGLSRLTSVQRHVLAKNARSGGATAKRLELATASQWEWLLSWLGDAPEKGGLTKAEQWELVLPQLGYMAALRNLRNLDQAGISEDAADELTRRLKDPEQVAKSRQLPFRFYSAYREVQSLRWGHSLERALELSLRNVPVLTGKTLILIDTSGSMQATASAKSKMSMVTAAALFGLALALRNPVNVDVYGFADHVFRVDGIGPGISLLRATEAFEKSIGRAGHGTQIARSVRATYTNQDRVFIFTDMQTFSEVGYTFGRYGTGDVSAAVPAHVPVYAWNVRGYQNTAMPVGHGNRHELGGLTDHTFSLVPRLEAGRDGAWPWLS